MKCTFAFLFNLSVEIKLLVFCDFYRDLDIVGRVNPGLCTLEAKLLSLKWDGGGGEVKMKKLGLEYNEDLRIACSFSDRSVRFSRFSRFGLITVLYRLSSCILSTY